MKTSLPYKFTLMCIVFCAIGFYLVSTYVYKLEQNRMIELKSEDLYTQAYYISNMLSPSYMEHEAFLGPKRETLESFATLGNYNIQLISPNGNVLIDTRYKQLMMGRVSIEEFDPGYFGDSYWKRGNFYNNTGDEVLSVISPVSSDFQIYAYVVIHQPITQVLNDSYPIFSTHYVTFAIMAIFLVLFLLIVILLTHIPLKEIVKGTEEYAKGNLSYVIKQLPNDEIGRLGDSLNYMAGKLDEMDSFQKKFISNVSHDFRSPLTSIKGYLEAISDGTIPPEMTQKYINIILFETERLTKLTNNLLALNDMDPKSVHLDITPFDINNIIKHTLETFEGTCKNKKISFDLTFSSKQLVVNGDMSKIQQIIYNLVDNAIKFSSNNSKIYISAQEKGEKVFISVKDTGCGIPKESLGKIWDRFYKSDSSRGKDKKGSGLGLAIVKEIIYAHGENIDVISTVDVGTEFIFSLPKAKG